MDMKLGVAVPNESAVEHEHFDWTVEGTLRGFRGSLGVKSWSFWRGSVIEMRFSWPGVSRTGELAGSPTFLITVACCRSLVIESVESRQRSQTGGSFISIPFFWG